MKFSHVMAAAILMGGLLSGAAQAGVTGAEGGTGSVTENTTTTINRTDNVHRVDTYQRSDTSSRTDTYKTNTFVNKVYEYVTQTHWAAPTTHTSHTSSSRTWVGGAGLSYGQAGGWGSGAAKPGRYVSYKTTTRCTGSGVETVSRSTSTDFLGRSTATETQTTVKPVTTYVGRDTSFVGRQTEKTRVTNVESDRQTNYSNDAIVIGDADALQAAYVAQGQMSQNTDIHVTHNDTYDHTDTYLNVDKYHTVNNYTHTTNITHTDRYRQTTTETKRNVTYYEVNTQETISPIVLDLDGDGALEASAGRWLPHGDSFDNTRVALFDFNANGFPVATEWVGPNDGLLVRPYADGTVDGSCLFGSNRGYTNGYEALGGLDADNNGQVEGAELQGLMVWQDRNSDATVNDGELLTLESLGITALGVNHNDMKGSYTRNGKTSTSFDWWPSTMELRKKRMGQEA